MLWKEKNDFPAFCEGLLIDHSARGVRKLHLRGPAASGAWGRVFRAFLLGEVLRAGRGDLALRARLLDEDDLGLLERVLPDSSARRSLRFLLIPDVVLETNVANIHWRLFHTPVPEESLRSAGPGLRLPGYKFPGKVAQLQIVEADLTGASFAGGKVSSCAFRSTSLHEASFCGARLVDCDFTASSSSLTDFSGAVFENSSFHAMDLTRAILHGVKFLICAFWNTTFGLTGEGEEIVFKGCFLRDCDVTRLVRGGFAWDKCRLESMSFAGLKPRQLIGRKTSFRRCDFIELDAPAARLEGAVFKDCLFSGASLREAHLQGARLEGVDFQPGPSSRAGLTEETTRHHPMHGSQSGYYAQSLAEGVWCDPELVRTADLRGADLRGVTLVSTDLFRVDLRGALMDADLRQAAKNMGAFVTDP